MASTDFIIPHGCEIWAGGFYPQFNKRLLSDSYQHQAVLKAAVLVIPIAGQEKESTNKERKRTLLQPWQLRGQVYDKKLLFFF